MARHPHLPMLLALVQAVLLFCLGCGRAEDRLRPLDAVLRDLTGGEYEVGLSAVRELSAYGSAAVPHLTAILRSSEDEEERIEALRSLARLGATADAAIPDLVDALRGPGRFARYEAQGAIAVFGAPAARALVADLQRDVDRARAAADVLGRFTEHAAIVVPALTSALDHEDCCVRYLAAFSLTSYGPRAAGAIDRLIALLPDDDLSVSSAAVQCLASIGAPAVGALTRAVSSEELWHKVNAAQALSLIGPSAIMAVPSLQRLQSDPMSGVRGMAAKALGAILPHAEALPILIRTLEDPDGYVRGRAAEAIGSLGATARDAAPALRAAMERWEPYEREKGEDALQSIEEALRAGTSSQRTR